MNACATSGGAHRSDQLTLFHLFPRLHKERIQMSVACFKMFVVTNVNVVA